jgi:hypothetical protein
MLARVLRSSALLVVFTLGSACVHIDNLGNPPTDDELANDGSPEQRIALRQQYAIAYENGSFFKPGDGTTMNDRAPQSPTTADNSLRYLEFAPEARQSLDSGLPFVARITASTEAGWVALGTGFGLGVVGSVVYAVISAAQGGDVSAAMDPSLLVTAAFSGILFGGIVGILLYLINDLALKPVLNGLAADGYRGAAKMFNEELERRIDKNAKAPVAPAAPPTPAPSSMPATPVSPPAPEAPPAETSPSSESGEIAPEGSAPPEPTPVEPAPVEPAPAEAAPVEPAPPAPVPSTP